MSVQHTPEDRFATWVQSLSGSAGTDSLLRFVPTENNAVELTHAHPSGLAQLLAGRRTRLSTLLRDPVQYGQARRTAKAMSVKVREVAQARGIDVGYMAAGLVTWRSLRGGRSEYYSSPLMLGRISLERREGVDDEELQLVGRAAPNRTLLRFLRSAYNVQIDPAELTQAGYRMARFNPSAPVSVLRDATRAAGASLVIEDRVVVSTFADVADPVDPSVVSVNHPVIRALLDEFAPEDADADTHFEPASTVADVQAKAWNADDAGVEEEGPETEADGWSLVPVSDAGVDAGFEDSEDADDPESAVDGGIDVAALERELTDVEASHPDRAQASEPTPMPSADTLVDDVLTPGADERDPADELLVLESDDDAYQALDAVSRGKSVTVNTPPGTDRTALAVNAALRMAAQGKRVLMVAERVSTIEDVSAAFASVDLETALLKLDKDTDVERVRERLIDGILRNERAGESSWGATDKVLRDRRSDLLEHVRSLHSVRPRWGASPLQAMQELARLSAKESAPATTVRLKRSVLDAMPDRAPVVEQLQRAAELGSFSQETLQSPWYGAALRHQGEADDAVKLVDELAESIPELSQTLTDTAKATRIKPVASFAQWGETLRLLVAVRRSLDFFESDVFDKPVDDLIAATATSSWRRQRGVEMSAMTRSRLRKVAKEYVRPGVHLEDLHTALTQVRDQRAQWEQLATDRRYPSIPTGLERVLQTYRTMVGRLNSLQNVLPSDQPRLEELTVEDLRERLAHLQATEDHLETLPERTLLLGALREKGLGELLDDLTQRHVSRDAIADELELAWWQSVLEAMVSGDDYLAIQSASELDEARREFGRADARHLIEGATRVRESLGRRWKAAIADHRVGARDLRALLKIGEPNPQQLAALAPAVIGSVAPVWIGAPLYIPSVLPRWSRFDAAILLDAESLSLEASLTTLSRVDQVLTLGDPNTGAPTGLSVAVDEQDAPTRSDETPLSAFEALNAVTLSRRLTRSTRTVDERLIGALSPQYEHGLAGFPTPATADHSAALVQIENPRSAPGQGTVKSTPTEVETVVRMVFEQLDQHPERSLAVIAGSPEHARLLARGISNALPHHPNAVPAFQRRHEPFLVTSAERVEGLQRDAVIFSLGFANSPQGRQPQHFGDLNGSDGLRHVMSSLSVARSWLRLVCALPLKQLEERMTLAHQGALAAGAPARSGIELLTRCMRSVEEPRTYELLQSAQTKNQQRGGARKDQKQALGALLADLGDRLREFGLTVIPNPADGLVMAVYAPVWHERTPLAVSVDSSQDYVEQTVRSRSRTFPRALEIRGWDPVQLWTIEVFMDPDTVAERLARRLGVDVEAARARAMEEAERLVAEAELSEAEQAASSHGAAEPTQPDQSENSEQDPDKGAPDQNKEPEQP